MLKPGFIVPLQPKFDGEKKKNKKTKIAMLQNC